MTGISFDYQEIGALPLAAFAEGGVLLRRLQVEPLENAAGRIEQDDVRLRPVDRLGIESDQAVGDSYGFIGPPGGAGAYPFATRAVG